MPYGLNQLTGRSGPCNVHWIRSLVHQCSEAGVPCFVKQLGSQAYQSSLQGGDGDGPIFTNDKKGGDMAEWPEDLRVRDFPVIR